MNLEINIRQVNGVNKKNSKPFLKVLIGGNFQLIEGKNSDFYIPLLKKKQAERLAKKIGEIEIHKEKCYETEIIQHFNY